MKDRGFTIIELLVVMVIIGMIFSVIFVSLQGSRAKGRDARREQDIKQIQAALELYSVANRQFPDCGANTVVIGSPGDGCLSTALISAGAISGLPTDPLGRFTGSGTGCGTDAGQFTYCYTSLNGATAYRLDYHLETNSIPGKAQGWQSL